MENTEEKDPNPNAPTQADPIYKKFINEKDTLVLREKLLKLANILADPQINRLEAYEYNFWLGHKIANIENAYNEVIEFIKIPKKA